MISSTFCILPFIHLSTRTNGDMQLCCHTNSSITGEFMPGCNRDNNKIINLENNKASNYWNTDFYKSVRKDMIQGKMPKCCSVCYNEEKSGYRSKRIWETEEWNSKLDFNEILKTVNEDGSMPYNIKYIDMKLGNACNLACIMCNPNDSNQLIKPFDELKKSNISDELKNSLPTASGDFKWFKDNNIYWNDIYNNLKNIQEFYIIGGEPTINSEFKNLLKKCCETGDSKHIKLRFNTNGHNLTPELSELYKEFNEVLMHLSMDGIEEYHELIRYPSKWNNMLEILEMHNELAKHSSITVDIDCTVSVLNIEHIPDFIKWKVKSKYLNINKVSFRGLIGLHLLHHPNYLSVKILSKNDKIRITKKYEELKVWLLENKSEKASKYPKLDAVVNFMNSEDLSHLQKLNKEYLKYI